MIQVFRIFRLLLDPMVSLVFYFGFTSLALTLIFVAAPGIGTT